MIPREASIVYLEWVTLKTIDNNNNNNDDDQKIKIIINSAGLYFLKKKVK